MQKKAAVDFFPLNVLYFQFPYCIVVALRDVVLKHIMGKIRKSNHTITSKQLGDSNVISFFHLLNALAF